MGVGCTGEVFRARHVRENKDYVVKRYNSMAVDHHLMAYMFERFKEMPLHDGIIPVKAFQLHKTPYYSVAEFDSGKKLLYCGAFKESEAWALIQLLADALGHAHKYGVAHGNLHPGNVFFLVDKDSEARLRIGDFGAGMLGKVHHVDLGESAYFAAPEQLLCLGQDFGDGKAEKWDVYHFGSVAFWLLNQVTPRGGFYQKLRAQEIAKAGGRPVPVDPIALATTMEKEGKLPWKKRIGSGRREARYVELIESCLSLDPAKRPVDMREVSQRFLDIESEFTLLETQEKAAQDLADAENRVIREKLKQKMKLFTARALVTILTASCIIAILFFLEYLNLFKETSMKNSELDQVMTNQQAHISILRNQVENKAGDLKQSRAAADASFYSMTQLSVGNQGEETLIKDLERSRTYYVRILKEALEGDAEPERGRALHSLAHIEKKLHRDAESLDHFQKAIDSFETQLRKNDAELEEEPRHNIVVRLADCYEHVGMMNQIPGSSEALASLTKAVWYLKQVLVHDPEDTAAATKLAESSFFLGQTLERQTRFEEAISFYSEAAEKAVQLRSLSDSGEKNKELETMISKLQFHAAESLRKTGREKESVDAYIATIESVERLRSLHGYTRDETLIMARSYLSLGDIFGNSKDITNEDKDQVYNEALRLLVPLNRQTPDHVEIAALLCHSLSRLARIELAADHRRDGYNLSLRGIEVLDTALKKNPENLNGFLELAEARLGHLDFLSDDKASAQKVSQRGVESATMAHDLLLQTARKLSEIERELTNQKLRRIFADYGTICSELGQDQLATKCLSYASFKLSYQD